MSVIQSIRDKGAWIIFGIIALALIAFILQDGVRRGGRSTDNTTLGKVNGEKIERLAFEEKLTLQERMYGSQGAQREQLIGSLWNQEVERIVMQQEFDKLGLQVTSNELSEILFGENSPLRQEFTDPKTGVFRVNDAKQAFAQIKKSKNAEQVKMINSVYIEPTIEQALRNKYQGILQQAAYIPKWLIEKQKADNNAISSISYAFAPYASISDSTVKVSDDEISAYVNKHSNQFKKEEETRTITYVGFNSAPSQTDSLTVLNQVKSYKNDFAVTNDAKGYLAKVGTDLPFYDSYFSKAKMQQANKDSFMNLATGSVYGPYLDGSSYVLAKMVGVKNWPDSVTVRHILIGTVNPQNGQVLRADTTAKKLIDSIESAVKAGADFATLCAKYSDDQGSKDKAGVYPYFPQGQMVIPFNDYAFDHSVGTKGVVKTDFGYHYMEILGQKNFAPAYKIGYLSKPIVASNETVSAANTAAAQFAASAKNKKSFDENAIKVSKQLMIGNDIKANDNQIVGLGASRQLVRWTYEHTLGDVSDPQEVGDKYIVAIVSAVNKAGTMSVAEARPLCENILRNEKKAKVLIDTKIKGSTLEAIAASVGTSVQRNDSLSFAAPFIPNMGSEPKVIGAAFNKALQGKISEPIAGSGGVYAIRVENNSAKTGAADETALKQALLQSARMAAFRGIDALKKTASVTDNRSKFY
ncbi:MAG: peptidylprolyl isomerase [Bacteroidota bacterium]